jgi:hypothetical protein
MRRVLKWLGLFIAAVVLLAIAVSYFIDEPLRRRTEQKINAALTGYTVRIGKLDFHPIGFSLDLEDCVIFQDAHPDPPVAQVPNLSASVNWRALIFGRIVADFEIDSPKIFLNLTHARQEQKDKVPVEKRGWQEALQAIYPLKINEFIISNGELTYVDQGPDRPLELTNINFHAQNIRNVRSEEGVYPSLIHLDSNVFGKGKIILDGHADFLAEPHVGFKAAMSLEGIDLNYFKPITDRYHFTVRNGLLSTSGDVEYAAHRKVIDMPKLNVRGLQADYVHTKEEEAPTKELSQKTERGIQKTSNEPTLQARVNEINIVDGELGVINRASKPNYRLFVTDAQIRIENLGNHSETGVAVGKATGKFMGSGKTHLVARLRPRAKTANFDFDLSIEQTDMSAMNNLLRAYANVDVVAGLFSFYSEMAVRDGMVRGYVKPLFREVDVYNPRQDRHKGVLRKIYEGVIGGLSWVLENRPREEVATTTKVSGTLSNPQASTVEIVLGLVQNAFFKSIVPGLEQTVDSQRNTR